ncbi:hypothetical protein EGW08_004807 [Elysia chlorotica]|uniref:Uncharacterized protein n=1 Tax=Elysia chlorotica TaxID=188477 RepID=A0A3S1ABC1_ELYCH|nr:hypothetical protein EGW08_004807 [Elysia chlorotica]
MKVGRTIVPAAHSNRCRTSRVLSEKENASDFECSCCPIGRSGHRVVVSEDSIYSLGGFNPAVCGLPDNRPIHEPDERGLPLFQELWRFNISSRRWQMLDDFQSVPPTIASHTIAKTGRWLFCFGGTSIPFGLTATNVIYRYDLQSSNKPLVTGDIDVKEDEIALRSPDDFRWHLVPVTGDIPEERYGHSMTMSFPDIYIVGGTSGHVYNAEVFHLDLRNGVGKWTKLSSDTDPKQPSGRYRHETAFDGELLYVFGGGTDQEAFPLTDVHTFNIVRKEWGEIKTLPDPQHGHPAPRKCHSCSQYKNDVYLVGGVSGTLATNQVTCYDDIWRYSLSEGAWTKFSFTLTVPLYFHSADICEKTGAIWIFGGVTNGRNANMRTNRLIHLQVKVGSLLELTWTVICNQVCNRWDRVDMDELGIPGFLQARLQS